MYHLLSLTGFTKISTTTDPRTDWCGYPQSTAIPLGNIYGEMILLLDHSKSVDRFSPPFNSTCLNFFTPFISLIFAKCISRQGSDQVDMVYYVCMYMLVTIRNVSLSHSDWLID